MSNLRDFAVTLADAWERAACSISQLLTPPPGVPPRTSSSFLTVGRAMAGTSDSHLSPLTEDGVGSSCEFIPQSTLGLGDLSVFVLTSDVASKVCIGAVTGGGLNFAPAVILVPSLRMVQKFQLLLVTFIFHQTKILLILSPIYPHHWWVHPCQPCWKKPIQKRSGLGCSMSSMLSVHQCPKLSLLSLPPSANIVTLALSQLPWMLS